MPAYNREAICQFCNTKIIPPKKGFRSSANGNYICEDCVKLLGQALDVRGKSDGKAKAKKRNKKMTPREIKKELDKYIIDQDSAKISIAIAVYNHYKRMDIKSDVKLSKSNVLLIGPTGSGKTLLAQTVAKMLDVPFAIADCTSLTEAGYVGDDVETILTKLLRSADGNVEKAERGIIFLDEIDKIAKSGGSSGAAKDPAGEGVQQALLKLVEGTIANVPVNGGRRNPNEKYVQVNTENILFICGGAFPGLEDIIKERLNRQASIGFLSDLKDKYDNDPDLLAKVTVDDIRSYGMIPEFIGRLPIIFTLQGLTKESLVRILKEPKNAIIRQYQKLLAVDEVSLTFDDGALEAIAERALEKKTGARALRAIIEEFMLDIMYEIPKDDNIGSVEITRAYIEKTGGPVISMRMAGITADQKGKKDKNQPENTAGNENRPAND